jgi:hypothetical protein
MRRRPGLLVSGLLAVAWGLSVLPGRWALAGHHAAYGADRTAELVTGLAADAPYVVALLVLANAVVLALLAAWTRGWPTFRVARKGVACATAVVFVFVLFGSVGATEFMIERGLYPTLFDASVATDDWGYVRAALGTFALTRFVVPTAISLAVFVASTVGFLRWTRGAQVERGRREVAHSALVMAGVAGLGFAVHRGSPWMFDIPDWRAVESPASTFFHSLGSSRENVRLGYITALTSAGLDEADVETGARLVGLPAPLALGVAPASCSPHPHAEPLDPPLVPGREAPEVPSSRGAQLGGAIAELSRELARRPRSRLRVWHVTLESFRADDVNALSPRAAADVTPVVNALYRAARAERPHVVAASAMYGAGSRSSQGLAAALCGLGTMPFGLSFARDVGLPPMRCLPDVLRDASFEPVFYYGSNPGFDNTLGFLRHHGFERTMTERDFAASSARQGWGLSDRVVFRGALADSLAHTDVEAQYNLVATLTNHHPFTRPSDFPAEVDERLRRVIAEAPGGIGVDDVARLETMAYTDFALGEFLDALSASEDAQDSVVVVSADHATADTLLWRDGTTVAPDERARARSQIPFFVVLPDALVESADASAVEAAVTRLNARLDDGPLSQNDIPRFVLGLLSETAQLRGMAPEWRWHTLGGQALSPRFAVPAHPELAVLGIDAGARLFGVTREGAPVDLDEVMVPLTDPREVGELRSVLRPTAAWLAALLSGYGRACWSTESVRARR